MYTIAILSITVKPISSLAATCIRTYSVVTVLFTLLLTTSTFIDVWIHCKHCIYTQTFKQTIEIITHTITASSITVKPISSLAATCIRTYSVLTVLFTLLLTTGTFIDVWMHCNNHNHSCELNLIFKWTVELHTIAPSSIAVKTISILAATCVRTYSVLTVLFTLILTIGTFIDVWMYCCKHLI